MTDKPGSTPPVLPSADFTGPPRIGPYTLICELGRGGMGVVYLAQHAQLGRIVALKVLPSGGSAATDLEMRFLREARTIARLTHPHIVAVHDAGRDHGHAFFAMEYLEDGDLARRLREKSFTPREAAALLRSVADAIAYSHEAGVLHRDLKPSNILLAAGAPRVADFGLAAELDSGSGLTARTAILGTPHYLAPEALSGGSAATGVASDIYSLGVILHEVLTGRTPFAGASPAELPGLLAQGDAPDVQLLAPHVPRDLATICAKCLEFEAARRYATAAALAEDLRRFLAGEPILARPVSAPSQLFRWARRRPALAATWLLSFSLAAASLAAAFLINRERLRANREAASSAALAEFLRRDFLERASAGQASDVSLRAVMDSSLEKIAERFADAPLGEATLRLSFATTFFSLGEFNRAEPQFRRALLLRTQHLGPHAPETLHTALELAHCLNNEGRSPEASRVLQPTVVNLLRLRGAADADSIAARELESNIERSLGHHAKAEELARDTLALVRRVLPPDHELMRGALINLADALALQGRSAEALGFNRELADLADRYLSRTDPQALSAHVSLAMLEGQLGQAAEAEAKLRRLHAQLAAQLGAEHPRTLRARSELGTLLSKNGQTGEAVIILADVLGIRQRVQGPDHPYTLLAMKHLALARGRHGDVAGGIQLLRELIELSRRSLGPDHLTTANSLRNLASYFRATGRYPEALPLAREAHAITSRTLGPDDPNTLIDEETLALALDFTGQPADAEPHWRHLIEVFSRLQPDHWHTHLMRGQLGCTLHRLERPTEAEPLLRESYAALSGRVSELPAPQKRMLAAYPDQLAQICAASGREAEAAGWRAKSAPAK